MFWGHSKWQQIKQCVPRLITGLLSSENHVRFKEEYDVYPEACFSQKNVYKWTKPEFAWVEKTVHEVEIHWLSSKEKVLGTVISKDYAVFSDMKRPLTIALCFFPGILLVKSTIH